MVQAMANIAKLTTDRKLCKRKTLAVYFHWCWHILIPHLN